ISSQILNGEFSFKDNILNFSTSSVNIADFREFLPDLNLDGEAVIKATIDVDKKIVNGSAELKRFSVFDFKNLYIQSQFDYAGDTVNLKSFVNGQDLNINLSGKIDKLSTDPYLDLDLSLYTLKLYSIPEIKKLDIDGLISGRGKVSGRLKDIDVNLSGTAKTFRYKDINLTDLSYTFNYKNKMIEINSNLPDNTLLSKVSIDLGKSTTDIYLKANNFILKPVENFLAKEIPFIKDLKPYQTSGDIGIKILHHGFETSLNLNNTKIYPLNFKEPITLSITGKISDKERKLHVDGKAQKLLIDDNFLENLSMKVSVVNSDVRYILKTSFKVSQAEGSFSVEGNFDTDKNILNGIVLTDGNVKTDSKTIPTSLNYKISGSLDNLQIKGRFSIEKSVIDMTGSVKSQDKQVYNLELSSSPFSYKLNGLSVDIGGIYLRSTYNRLLENPVNGSLKFTDVSVVEKSYPLVKLPQLSINFDKNKIYVEKTTYSGIFSGKLEEAVYSLKDNNLKVLINGNIDRKYLSEFLQFINLDGNLKFVFSFNGKVQDFSKNYNIIVSGENLRLRTPYTQGTVMLEDFNIKTKEYIVLNIKGKTKSSFGDAYTTINGTSDLNFDTASFNIKSENFPVRYKNIFTGIVNSDVKVNSKKKDITIDATSQLTGRAKIEPDIFENQETSGEKPEILKKIKLNINLSTLSPIFIEGSWGKAYLDGNIVITGTAEKPILNGKLNISYGKVALMRNIYNIDFINVKITNNDLYVNGRLSTFISGTNIFVNVSGPSNNLRYDFFSTPPKSKEEILTLLLLKKTPEQLASSGIFTVLGRVGEILVPFKVEEEEKGLFGTGVNVNIIPSYSPVQGIVFSVYLQKYLTRRIYLGLSRPLSNYQSYNYLGWYEAGFKLTERTSFVIKTYENRSRSGEITFTLPFDF
ncbi:MAG: translocation/assembly module TamB domain-containing protein, partial [Hydrogenothermaceae bacterium]